MTLDFFLKYYFNDEVKPIKLEVLNNKLYLTLEMNSHLDLIANGYRPELDLKIVKTFIFVITKHDDFIINKDIDVKITDNKFIVNGILLTIIDNIVEIHN